MGFLSEIVEILDETDSLLGPEPEGFDLRPTTVSVVTRTWPGDVVGDRNGGGAPSDSALDLPPWIRVRHVSQREIAGSGGRFETGDVIVGPIRPFYTDASGTTGGFTQSQLDPARAITTENVEIVYVLAQENETGTGIAGEYGLVELRRDRATKFFLVLTRRETTP